MSDREPSNPGVSVFHFTSKVSNAKIRKYVQATGRGMNPPQATSKQAPTPSPAPVSSASDTAVTNDAASMPPQEAPPKKRKLKINGPRRSPMPNDDAPKDDGENIAVARPKRTIAAPARYADDAAFATSEDDEHKVLDALSPAASSDLSSLESAATPATEEKENAKSAAFAAYGNFSQFYIQDHDKEDPLVDISSDSEPRAESVSDTTPELVPEPVKPKKAGKGSKQPSKVAKQPQPRKERQSQRAKQQSEELELDTPERLETQQQQDEQQTTQPTTQQPKQRTKRAPKDPTKQRTKQQIRQQMEQQAAAQGASTKIESQRGAQGYEGQMYYPPPPGMHMQGHMPPPAPLPLQIPPPPFPPPEAPVMEHIGITYYARPSEMKNMVETLSLALTQFGGLPPPPQEPEPAKRKSKSLEEIPADTLLAAFADDDSDAEMMEKAKTKASVEEDPDRVRPKGEEDEQLTFGIQFIMNALKSWAQQRLYQTRIATWQRDWLMYQDAIHARQPGNPMPQDPANLHSTDGYIDLSATPEGHAVEAFRAVIESGCLQKNVIVPASLGGALRHLYSQIDALINQHQKAQQPWHCMSYKAQIDAHATRVEKHKVHQARVQEEIARQQHESHQLVMQQMGMPLKMASPYYQPPPPPLRQPMPGRNHSQGTPNHVPSPYGTPSGMAPSPTSFNGGQPFSVPDHPAGPRGHPPRMGAGMHFSFPPTNQAHVEAWGPQAFPAMSADNHIIPNRGPMNGSPANSQSTIVRGDKTTLPSRPASSLATNENQTSRRASIKGKDAHAHPSLPPSPYDSSANGFTAVNRPASRAGVESPAGAPTAQLVNVAGKKRVTRSDSTSETRSLRSSKGGARAASRISQADPETIVVDDD